MVHISTVIIVLRTVQEIITRRTQRHRKRTTSVSLDRNFPKTRPPSPRPGQPRRGNLQRLRLLRDTLLAHLCCLPETPSAAFLPALACAERVCELNNVLPKPVRVCRQRVQLHILDSCPLFQKPSEQSHRSSLCHTQCTSDVASSNRCNRPSTDHLDLDITQRPSDVLRDVAHIFQLTLTDAQSCSMADQPSRSTTQSHDALPRRHHQ